MSVYTSHSKMPDAEREHDDAVAVRRVLPGRCSAAHALGTHATEHTLNDESHGFDATDVALGLRSACERPRLAWRVHRRRGRTDRPGIDRACSVPGHSPRRDGIAPALMQSVPVRAAWSLPSLRHASQLGSARRAEWLLNEWAGTNRTPRPRPYTSSGVVDRRGSR